MQACSSSKRQEDEIKNLKEINEFLKIETERQIQELQALKTQMNEIAFSHAHSEGSNSEVRNCGQSFKLG